MNEQGFGQRQRLLLAVALSALIFIGFDWVGREFFGVGVGGQYVAAQQEKKAEEVTKATAEAAKTQIALAPQNAGLGSVALANARIKANVSLQGGRLDSLTLNHYAETMGGAKGYTLFKPTGERAEYVAGGWLGAGIAGPDENTPWRAEVAENADVRLVWENTTGQKFTREIKLRPDTYVAEVMEKVENAAALPVSLTPFVQIHRADGAPKEEHSSWVNFSGPMGVVDGITQEHSYKDLLKDGPATAKGSGGWWGITGQYFMTAVVPDSEDTRVSASEVMKKLQVTERGFRHDNVGGRDFYTASVTWQPQVVVPGGSTEIRYLIYAGPKQEKHLRLAGHDLDRAIQWGWFKAIAKPLYHTLVWLHDMLFSSWALAVIALTLLLKIVTFPLANKSYHAMAKIKKLQPRIEQLRERYKDDQQALALEMMKIYREEKVNPMSGCWPVAIQIPIFFAMYKVVLVAFEFRHAALGLWIPDMSAADPFFVLPVLMGISMYVQFKLNPPPADPVQATMFKWMPVFMTVMFLWFPSGLVLYWLTNNVFSIAQQAFIMRRDRAI